MEIAALGLEWLGQGGKVKSSDVCGIEWKAGFPGAGPRAILRAAERALLELNSGATAYAVVSFMCFSAPRKRVFGGHETQKEAAFAASGG